MTGYEADKIFREKLKRAEICPFLYGLKKATLDGLVKFCEYRLRQNELAVNRKLNSVESNCGMQIDASFAMNKYGCCVDCKMYPKLKEKKIPEPLKGIVFLTKEDLEAQSLSRV